MEKIGGVAGGSARRTLASEFDKMLYAKIRWSPRCGDPYEFLTDETLRSLTEAELKMRFPRAYGKLQTLRASYQSEQNIDPEPRSASARSS